MGWLEKRLLPALETLSYLHRAYVITEPHFAHFIVLESGLHFREPPFPSNATLFSHDFCFSKYQ